MEREPQIAGRKVLLVSNSDIGSSLKKASSYDSESDAITLSHAANIVKRYVLKRSQNPIRRLLTISDIGEQEKLNTRRPSTFPGHCYFPRVSTKVCDVLLDPTQCCHLVLHSSIH
uniref:Uncharacterized protein n=1 Tax=Timema shepardi TaxID=629360 RepID=A0A7R9AWF9_TIMSH|nr:unnamed protein product [Timema shepardi]